MVTFTQTKENQQWHTLEDGFDNLTRGTAPMPVPGQDEVLVEIKAVSLNYRDTEGMSISPVNHSPIHPLPSLLNFPYNHRAIANETPQSATANTTTTEPSPNAPTR